MCLFTASLLPSTSLPEAHCNKNSERPRRRHGLPTIHLSPRLSSSLWHCARVLSYLVTTMFRLLRMQLLGPLQLSRLVIYLPQFVRLFYRLILYARVPGRATLVTWRCLRTSV